jgi:hypothetical protein
MRQLRLTPAFFHPLLCVSDGPKHGYGMMLEIEERTDGSLRAARAASWIPARRAGRLDAATSLRGD